MTKKSEHRRLRQTQHQNKNSLTQKQKYGLYQVKQYTVRLEQTRRL